jgi:perosamine synthetase
MIPVNIPIISAEDIQSVVTALTDTMISGESPPVRKFEENLAKLLDVKHCISVSTGTSALDLCMEVLEISEVDECIVPNFTIISSVSNLMRKGARIKLVDADKTTWSMNAEITRNYINDRTSLIVPTHIYGLPTDVNFFMDKAKEFGAFILEDAAEALGLKYHGKQCGSLGDASIFSFYANKIVTGGEGGAICTNSETFAQRARFLRNLAFSANERFVNDELGWNYRWNALSASLANSQLSRLDALLKRKREIAQYYIQNLGDIKAFSFHPEKSEGSINSYWVFGILLSEDAGINAKELQKTLYENGVETRRFFCPIHLQPVSRNYNVDIDGDFPVSSYLWEYGIYLPSGLGTTKKQQDIVIEVLRRIFE